MIGDISNGSIRHHRNPLAAVVEQCVARVVLILAAVTGSLG